MVIAVVALLVIGPEKLPKIARTVGAFTGRMQRYVAQVKDEINREVRFEELQKLQQEIKQSVENNVVKPIEQEADALRGSIYAASGDAKIKTKTPQAKKQIKAAITKPKTTTTKTSNSKATKPKVTQPKVAKVRTE
jgi:sec-independent protein translocase protein TatB